MMNSEINTKEQINMKIVTVNINPPDKCIPSLKQELKKMSIEERASRIYKIVKDTEADIIFLQNSTVPYTIK